MEFDLDFRAVIIAILFFGGSKAITAATEWFKKIFPNMQDWTKALIPVLVGLVINIGGVASLGYFQEYGTIAIVASIIMGFISGFYAMGIYDTEIKK